MLRIPLLAGMGQVAAANIELRRFVELIMWTIYFADHPVEWDSFEREPDAGFSGDLRHPIHYWAHRGFQFYADYVRERMGCEESTIAIGAVDSLREVQGELNADVHPGRLATTRARIPVIDRNLLSVLDAFHRVQRKVFSDGCILIAALRRKNFDRLQASERAHFDWLIGSRRKKLIRAGSFGLRR